MNPRCCDPDVYLQWQALRRMSLERVHFCNDCTPEFALHMRTCGLCDHPEVRFMPATAQGGWEGVFPVSGDLFEP